MGRFINADDRLSTRGDLSGMNLYAYCCNNTVMFSAPNGHLFIIVCIAVGAILGAVAGGYAGAKISRRVFYSIKAKRIDPQNHLI